MTARGFFQLQPYCDVLQFPSPHFFSHPIMENEARNPQQLNGISSIHNGYGQIFLLLLLSSENEALPSPFVFQSF